MVTDSMSRRQFIGATAAAGAGMALAPAAKLFGQSTPANQPA